MVPAGLSLSRSRHGPSVITQPTALFVCVEGGSSGLGGAGLGCRDCDSPPHQRLLDFLVIHSPFPVSCASARVRLVVNKPRAIGRERDREGSGSKGSPRSPTRPEGLLLGLTSSATPSPCVRPTPAQGREPFPAREQGGMVHSIAAGASDLFFLGSARTSAPWGGPEVQLLYTGLWVVMDTHSRPGRDQWLTWGGCSLSEGLLPGGVMEQAQNSAARQETREGISLPSRDLNLDSRVRTPVTERLSVKSRALPGCSESLKWELGPSPEDVDSCWSEWGAWGGV